MHKELSILFVFEEDFDKDKILKILARGKEVFSLKYYAYNWGEAYFSTPELTPDDALKRLEEQNENSPVLCKFEDTSFYFIFHRRNNFFTLLLWPSSYPWKKEFLNGVPAVEFDMQRYLRLMLQLVNGLQINKIEAKIEWE